MAVCGEVGRVNWILRSLLMGECCGARTDREFGSTLALFDAPPLRTVKDTSACLP
jgi:hypothetical protein